MSTQWTPIYTGDPDHDDALDAKLEAADESIQELLDERVGEATDTQLLDAVGTMLGMMDPEELTQHLHAILHKHKDISDYAIASLHRLCDEQLRSDLEPDVTREVYAEFGIR